MPPLNPIKGKELIRLLQKQGFATIRQSGSHVRLVHPSGLKTSVPIHTGEQLGRGLLRKILRDINLSVEEFANLRKK